MKKENHSFFKSISVLTAGSAISIVFLAIQHIALPYIFTPAELGIKSVILALPTACIAIICGSYDLPLVYEDDEKNIYPLLKLNFIINFILSSIITVVNLMYFIVFERDLLRFWYITPAIWIYLVSYGLTLTLNSYNNRYREYQIISKMYVIRSAAQSLIPVILGIILIKWLKINSLAITVLVVPYCIGMAFGIYSQGEKIIKDRRGILNCDTKAVKEVALKHIKQPILSAPAMLANGFSYSLITIMTNAFFGETITGYYSLSITLLGLPITLISGNISKVYTKDASIEYEKTGCFRKAYSKNCLFLVLVSIPMFFCMFFLAPKLCIWIFGETWKLAGKYIQALSLMFSFRFISTALSPGLYICKKQNAELIIQIAFVLVTAISGIIAHLFNFDSVSFMWILGFARSFVMLIHILVIFYWSKTKDVVS